MSTRRLQPTKPQAQKELALRLNQLANFRSLTPSTPRRASSTLRKAEKTWLDSLRTWDLKVVIEKVGLILEKGATARVQLRLKIQPAMALNFTHLKQRAYLSISTNTKATKHKQCCKRGKDQHQHFSQIRPSTWLRGHQRADQELDFPF